MRTNNDTRQVALLITKENTTLFGWTRLDDASGNPIDFYNRELQIV